MVNKELKKVKNWLDANKLAMNIAKTDFVIFHSPQNALVRTVNIKIGKNHINQAKYVKFRGILLNESLSWKYHFNKLSKEVSKN